MEVHCQCLITPSQWCGHTTFRDVNWLKRVGNAGSTTSMIGLFLQSTMRSITIADEDDDPKAALITQEVGHHLVTHPSQNSFDSKLLCQRQCPQLFLSIRSLGVCLSQEDVCLTPWRTYIFGFLHMTKLFIAWPWSNYLHLWNNAPLSLRLHTQSEEQKWTQISHPLLFICNSCHSCRLTGQHRFSYFSWCSF